MGIIITTTAKIYANSLIEISDDYILIKKELETVINIVKSSNELSAAIENPAISRDTKFEIIENVYKDQVDSRIINFIKILVDKNKFNLLEEIYQAYSNKSDELQNIKRVEVVSAVDLNEDWKIKITDRLKAKLNKNVQITEKEKSPKAFTLIVS